MADLSAQSADGRAIVTYHDDTGEPYKWVSDAVSILGYSAYNTIINIPLSRDDSLPRKRPNLLKGQLTLNAQIAFDSGFNFFIMADLVVTGFIGATGTVISSLMLGGSQPVSRITFDSMDTFDRISVDARLNQNGVPSSNPAHVFQATVSAVLLMYQ